MVSPYNTEPGQHIKAMAAQLKDIEAIQAPEWAAFVRTGVHKTLPPEDKDWWYIRAAAVLRTVGTRGPVGVNKLRKKFGGRQRRGYQPATFARASGNILRKCLQQLEKAELVKQVSVEGHKGRVLTPKGQSVLAQAAKTATHETQN